MSIAFCCVDFFLSLSCACSNFCDVSLLSLLFGSFGVMESLPSLFASFSGFAFSFGFSAFGLLSDWRRVSLLLCRLTHHLFSAFNPIGAYPRYLEHGLVKTSIFNSTSTPLGHFFLKSSQHSGCGSIRWTLDRFLWSCCWLGCARLGWWRVGGAHVLLLCNKLASTN